MLLCYSFILLTLLIVIFVLIFFLFLPLLLPLFLLLLLLRLLLLLLLPSRLVTGTWSRQGGGGVGRPQVASKVVFVCPYQDIALQSGDSSHIETGALESWTDKGMRGGVNMCIIL